MELWCYAFRYRNHSIFPLLFFVLNTFSSSYFSYVDRRNGKKVVDSWYCSLRCVFEGACVADCRMKFSGYKVEKIDCRMKKTFWRMKKKVAVNFWCQNGEFVSKQRNCRKNNWCSMRSTEMQNEKILLKSQCSCA